MWCALEMFKKVGDRVIKLTSSEANGFIPTYPEQPSPTGLVNLIAFFVSGRNAAPENQDIPSLTRKR